MHCCLIGFVLAALAAPVPKTWEAKELASLELPRPGLKEPPVHISAEFYYRIPVMPIYKSYPIYAPGRGPEDYLEWLRKQEPSIVFDAARLRTDEDWRRAGELVFDAPVGYENDLALEIVSLAMVRDRVWYRESGVPVTREGIMPFARYVVRRKGAVEVGNAACGMCHTRVMPDGSLVKGAQGNFPFDRTLAFRARGTVADRLILKFLYLAPWARPDTMEPATLTDMQIYALQDSIPPGVLARHGTSLVSPVQIPDLIGIANRRYLDRTGLVRHRNIGDLMRYAALNQAADDFTDYGGFMPVKLFSPSLPDPAKLDTAKIGLQRARYSDEQLYALARYLYSLQPPANPNLPDELSSRGRQIFEREGCAGCHTPPLYTNNRLTPAPGFTIPPAHKRDYDVMEVSAGTDPTLALRTRRGTGYYKVPSLLGVWYRGPFEHNGSVATLEDWFDAARLRQDYVPTAWKGNGVKTRAVKGHEFGLNLSPVDKKALIAFLRTL